MKPVGRLVLVSACVLSSTTTVEEAAYLQEARNLHSESAPSRIAASRSGQRPAESLPQRRARRACANRGPKGPCGKISTGLGGGTCNGLT